jgi:hypothetical protein
MPPTSLELIFGVAGFDLDFFCLLLLLLLFEENA